MARHRPRSVAISFLVPL